MGKEICCCLILSYMSFSWSLTPVASFWWDKVLKLVALDCHPCELMLETAGLLLEPGRMDRFYNCTWNNQYWIGELSFLIIGHPEWQVSSDKWVCPVVDWTLIGKFGEDAQKCLEVGLSHCNMDYMCSTRCLPLWVEIFWQVRRPQGSHKLPLGQWGTFSPKGRNLSRLTKLDVVFFKPNCMRYSCP